MTTTAIGIKLTLDGASQAEASLKRVSGGIDKMGASASAVRSALGGLAGAIGGALSAREFIQAADAVTVLQNQLKLATGSTQGAATAYEALFDIAQRSRFSFTELGSTYASIARAGESLGLSQQRLLGVTEAIGNAMTISGGSAAGMQAALTQLGQGLASGTLRGEELNSVMEQTPRLARAIADGLGVTIGQLRAMGAAGQLTGDQVIKALEGQAAVLRSEVAGATLTVGQAMTTLQNATIKTVGEFDKASGASAALAGGISDLAGVVGAMGRAFSENETAIRTTLGVLAGVGTAAAIARTATALGGLAAGVGGVAGAVGALRVTVAALNPVTLALLGLSAVAGGAAAYNNQWRGTADGIKETIKQLQQANTLATGNLERMQGRPEVVEAINKAIAQRSQNIAELTAKLRAMNAEGAALNAPAGSVGSGDTALLRAQNSDRAKRQQALGLLMADLATPNQKLQAEIKKQKKLLGDLYSPQVEALIRQRFAGSSASSAGDKKDTARENDLKVGELRNRLAGEAAADALSEAERAADAYARRLESLVGDTPIVKTQALLDNVRFLDEAFFDGKISPQLYDEAIANLTTSTEKLTAKTKDLADSGESDMQRLIQATEGWGRQFTDTFADMVTTGKGDFRGLADSVIADLTRMQIQKRITAPLLKAGNEFLDFALGSGNFLSFDGGGYTGSGPRSGGMDGKGGYLAMLHPRETVIDHTKGRNTAGAMSGGTVTNISVSVAMPAGGNRATALQFGADAARQIGRASSRNG